MEAQVCKRTTADPLLRRFLDHYGLHLLAIPRSGAAVGDVFLSDGRRTAPVGAVRNLVTPAPDVTIPTIGEPMADIAGRLTRGIELGAGLGLLEAFLIAAGASAIVDSVKANYSRTGTKSLAFAFEDPVRDHVDVLLLAEALAGRQFVGPQVFGPGHRFYVATSVVRSRSLSVQAVSDHHTAVEIGAGLAKVAEAKAEVDVQLRQDGRVTYTGRALLAFGLELFEIVHDEESGELRFAMPGRPVPVRGHGTIRRPPRAVVGDPTGSALLSLD
jgi:hypothetical protein